MNNITLFGTCRINGVHKNNNINNQVNYPHSTKEIIQEIYFLTGAITIPHPYNVFCFRSGILQNSNILLTTELQEAFSRSTLCIIEICSMKKYMCDGFYLHHLAVDKRFQSYNNTHDFLKSFECTMQNAQEIEDDILHIKKLIGNKKLIIVSHYNAKLNEEYIEARNKLIKILSEICSKQNILLIKPSEVLINYTQNEVMTDDLGHYTPFGHKVFSDFMNSYIEKQEEIL